MMQPQQAARGEYRRLAALRAYDLIDTPPDPALDLITRLAAELLDVPFACISLVDEREIFLKAIHGLTTRHLGTEPGLCATTVDTDRTRQLPHVLDDPLAANHPVVVGPPHVRSYAGTPLRTPDRFPIGTLCAMDTVPREFSSDQIAALERLGHLAMEEIEAASGGDHRERRAADRYEAMARRLIEPPPTGVIILNRSDVVVFASRTATQLLDVTPGDALAKIADRVVGDDETSRLLAAIRGGVDIGSELAFAHETDDGGSTQLAWRVERSNDSQTLVTIRMAATQPDDTAAVLEAQKLESLGVLAGGVAHDLNNILGAVIGNTGLARDSLDDRDRVIQYLETIDRAADRASALCEQLLVYAGGGQFSVTTTDLDQLIRTASILLEATTPKKAVLQLDLAEELPPTECDPEQLQHVLFNLVSNATEALDFGSGSICLSTGTSYLERVDLDRLVLGDGVASGLFVWLQVADDGRGMDPETTRLLFDPFFTTKTHGHGLGMAAVLGIIRSHRGAISVESAVGTGTTIRVYLPVSQEPGRATEPASSAPAARPSRLTVLVVDDETEIRVALRDILTQNGHRVFTAPDGLVGKNIIDELGSEIDVAIIDLTMPTMDGSELYDEISRGDTSISVIFSSGYIQSPATRELTENGRAQFLKKPYRASALLAALADVSLQSPSDSITRSSAAQTSNSRAAE